MGPMSGPMSSNPMSNPMNGTPHLPNQQPPMASMGMGMGQPMMNMNPQIPHPGMTTQQQQMQVC